MFKIDKIKLDTTFSKKKIYIYSVSKTLTKILGYFTKILLYFIKIIG